MPINETYLDPVFLHVMADPVVCDDGFTYDRPTIEHHFRSRIEQEEERQRQEEGGEQSTDNAACCGARREIRLTSPRTNEIVSDRLLPNRNLDQQIVELIEGGHPDLTEEDIEDWKERREQKRENDRIRREEEQRARERQEERAREGERYERIRREEAAEAAAREGKHPTAPPSPTAPPQAQQRPLSEQVRLDRVVTNGQDSLSKDDLGLSVALCGNGSRVTPTYVSNVAPGGVVRCMVACCAKRLNFNIDYSWCKRCGRMACSSCLEFKVTDFSKSQSSELHSICGECVAQVVDTMNPRGAEGQARAFILNTHLKRYSNDLTSRAIKMQDRCAKLDAEAEFGPALRQLEDEVDRLRQTKENLEAQARDARERAERARNNDGSTAAGFAPVNSNVAELEAACEDLQRQYDELVSAGPGNDEESQIMYFTRLSDIEPLLEQKQMELVAARDEAPSMQEHTHNNVSTYGELQESCERLEREYNALVEQGAPADEEGQFNHMLALSGLQKKLEEAQLNLVQASTNNATAAANVRTSLNSFSSVASLIERLGNVSVVRSSQTVRIQPPPAQPQRTPKRTIMNRLMRSSQQQVPLAGPTRTSTTTITRTNPILPDVINDLRNAHASMMNAENGNDPIGRLESASQMMRALSIAEPHVIMLGDEYTHLLERAKEESMNQHMAAQESFFTDQDPQHSRQSEPTSHNSQDISDLQREFLRLSTVDATTLAGDDAYNHTMRLSELQHLLGEAEKNAFDKEEEICYPGFGQEDPVTTEEEEEDPQILDAIGFRDEDWPLPLGLSYPTTRMENQLELLRNALAQQLSGSERKYDGEYGERRRRLTEKRDRLEDEIEQARAAAQNAEASAEAEQERLRQREERRRREEEERRERERIRLEKERQAREEEERLRRRHAADEEATREAFAGAVGGDGNAARFGGRGDLRMCGRCKAGPIENFACADLAAHNDTGTTYKGNAVAARERPNHCPNCNWFDPDWRKWPMWDGVYGPHR
mmetsp:Transcript_4538/g.6801  ORF Transcript_4538/g.6801 Transcript_4538/m.6801 type:complete len:1001 (-) Transcript_4538:122-3124(-)